MAVERIERSNPADHNNIFRAPSLSDSPRSRLLVHRWLLTSQPFPVGWFVVFGVGDRLAIEVDVAPAPALCGDTLD